MVLVFGNSKMANPEHNLEYYFDILFPVIEKTGEGDYVHYSHIPWALTDIYLNACDPEAEDLDPDYVDGIINTATENEMITFMNLLGINSLSQSSGDDNS